MNLTRKLVYCAFFVSLIAVSSFIVVPVPIIPFVLTYQMTFLAAMILGGKWGALSVIIYMFAGLCGLPVFTSGGGLASFVSPTFGFIIGFVIGTFAAGKIANVKGKVPTAKRLIVAIAVNIVIVYLIGTVYCLLIMKFYIHTQKSLWAVLIACIIPIPKDILLNGILAFSARKLIPVIGIDKI